MVSFINLLDAVTFFLEALNWYTTSLSEKYSNDRLFSNEAKFSCYSAAWLTFWNPVYVAFKRWFFFHFLYYKDKYFEKNICKYICIFQIS